MDFNDSNSYEELLEWSKRLFNSIQAGILIIDADNKTIIDVNLAAALIIGSIRDEIIGKRCISYPCFKVGNCINCKNIPCPVVNLNLDIEDEESVLIRKDGTKLNLLETVSTMFCQGKKFLVKSFVNITNLKNSNQDWQEAEKILAENIIKTKSIHQSYSFKASKNKENLHKALDLMAVNSSVV